MMNLWQLVLPDGHFNPAITRAARTGRLDADLAERVTSWREHFGDEALTDDAQQWMQVQLTKIVEIPCGGTFTRRIGSHVILVTAETRRDPVGYRAALQTFS
jgi:hypothetical protein